MKKTPNNWRTSVIVPISKKGDDRLCQNHTGISLLRAPENHYQNIHMIIYLNLNKQFKN